MYWEFHVNLFRTLFFDSTSHMSLVVITEYISCSTSDPSRLKVPQYRPLPVLSAADQARRTTTTHDADVTPTRQRVSRGVEDRDLYPRGEAHSRIHPHASGTRAWNLITTAPPSRVSKTTVTAASSTQAPLLATAMAIDRTSVDAWPWRVIDAGNRNHEYVLPIYRIIIPNWLALVQ